jgi:hypothetical protein
VKIKRRKVQYALIYCSCKGKLIRIHDNY